MLNARMRLSAFGASLKSTQKKIDAAIDRLDILPSRNAEFVNRQAVKVGAGALNIGATPAWRTISPK